MSTVTTTGVGMLARLLQRVSSGDHLSAASFGVQEGYARSTVFDVVRRMEDAGLIERDGDGALLPGAAAVRLAMSEHGLVALHGPAEALLTSLRDQTGGTARLLAADGSIMLTLAGRRGSRDGLSLEAPIGTVARLTLTLRVGITRAQRDHAEAGLSRTALSLTN
ncbi:MAG TPA: hypothetical protein VFE52_04770, partial [Devosia sp.]|nr:hypothetical protein [Devosia sp.]